MLLETSPHLTVSKIVFRCQNLDLTKKKYQLPFMSPPPPFFFASVWAEGADCAVPKITTLYYYPYYNTKLAVITEKKVL